jgi:gliding motility associated protien GldN
LILFAGFISVSFAQKTPGVETNPKNYKVHFLESSYKRFYHPPKPMDTLVRPDVAVVQTLWRIIDINQVDNKMVFYGYSPKKLVDLFEIIKFGLLTGRINAFTNEKFSKAEHTALPLSEVRKRIFLAPDSVEERIYDADGNETVVKKLKEGELTSSDLQGYILKEDWYIDKHWGKTDRRITGICPVFYDKVTGHSQPLFWLYYNECRQLFSSFEAKNTYTDDRITFDELFFAKHFYSVIYKSSNVFDRNINSYKIGQDVYLETQKIITGLGNKDYDSFHE